MSTNYDNDNNLLGENINVIKIKNRSCLDASKEVFIELKTEN
jgi:hypothetical protein